VGRYKILSARLASSGESVCRLLAVAAGLVAGQGAAAGPVLAAVGQADREGLVADVARSTIPVRRAGGETVALAVRQGLAFPLRAGCACAVPGTVAVGPPGRVAAAVGGGKTGPRGAADIVDAGATDLDGLAGWFAIAAGLVAGQRAAAGPVLAAVGQADREGLVADVARSTIPVRRAGGETVALAVREGLAFPLRAGRGRAISRTVAAAPSRRLPALVRRGKAGLRRAGVVGGAPPTDRSGLVRRAGCKSDRRHQP